MRRFAKNFPKSSRSIRKDLEKIFQNSVIGVKVVTVSHPITLEDLTRRST